MMRAFCLLLLFLTPGLILGVEGEADTRLDYKAAPHNYWERPPQDAVTVALVRGSGDAFTDLCAADDI
jgi:hypothetical protein